MSRDYDLSIGMFTKDCKFDTESLATLKRSFVDLKLLATPPDMSALYTEAFLPKERWVRCGHFATFRCYAPIWSVSEA